MNAGRGHAGFFRPSHTLDAVESHSASNNRETGPHRAEQRYSEKTALLRMRQFLLDTRQLEPATPTQ
ncbi:hypothetical protein I546_5914 [Mycobacterium kansasii 732]|nr:hypothetical protein I546_5914 [Mycobacterium kansasii 732]